MSDAHMCRGTKRRPPWHITLLCGIHSLCLQTLEILRSPDNNVLIDILSVNLPYYCNILKFAFFLTCFTAEPYLFEEHGDR